MADALLARVLGHGVGLERAFLLFPGGKVVFFLLALRHLLGVVVRFVVVRAHGVRDEVVHCSGGHDRCAWGGEGSAGGGVGGRGLGLVD